VSVSGRENCCEEGVEQPIILALVSGGLINEFKLLNNELGATAFLELVISRYAKIVYLSRDVSVKN